MIRLFFTLVFLILFFIFSLPIFFFESILGLFNRRARDISSLRIVQWAFRVLLLISGVSVTVTGKENIPKDCGVVYVGNHRGFFDIIATYPMCPDLTGYMSKVEILKVPILSSWMKRLYCVFVDRKDHRSGMRALQKTEEQLKAGISTCIFPEGTRNKGGYTMLPFKTGAFRAAQKANAPIVLMAILNTRAVFEEHLPFLRAAHVYIEYSKPIAPHTIEGSYKELSDYCREQLQIMIEENQKRFL